MNRRLALSALVIALASGSAWASTGTPFAVAGYGVTVSSNGVLVAPTNFWDANRASILGATTVTNETDPRWSAVSNTVRAQAAAGAAAAAWGNHATNGYVTGVGGFWSNGLSEMVMTVWVVTGFDMLVDVSGDYVLGGYDTLYSVDGEGNTNSSTFPWLKSVDGLYACWIETGMATRVIAPIGDREKGLADIPYCLRLFGSYSGNPEGTYEGRSYSALDFGFAWMTRLQTTITVTRATSARGLVVCVGGNVMVDTNDLRYRSAITSETDSTWTSVSNTVRTQAAAGAAAAAWGDHSTNGYFKAGYTRYLARSTSGGEIWVTASRTGVTATVVGSGITINNPLSAMIQSLSIRWNGQTLGTTFTVNMGTNDWGNTSASNRGKPVKSIIREDGASWTEVQTASISFNSSTFTEFTIANLISTCINSVELRW